MKYGNATAAEITEADFRKARREMGSFVMVFGVYGILRVLKLERFFAIASRQHVAVN
jgi:hypothetical protein